MNGTESLIISELEISRRVLVIGCGERRRSGVCVDSQTSGSSSKINFWSEHDTTILYTLPEMRLDLMPSVLPHNLPDDSITRACR